MAMDISKVVKDIEEGDVSKDFEKMIQKISTSQVKASPSGSKVKKVEDYLDAAEKNATHYHPNYKKSAPSPKTKKGFSFGSPAKSNDKRFISKDLAKHQYLSTHSPGPKYTPSSFTDTPKNAQSIPKAQRLKPSKPDSVPGPQYEIPGTVGRQVTRESAPSYKMGQSARFGEGEYVSAQHSKGIPSRDTPAPNAYAPELTDSGPAYSFTTGGVIPPGKIYLSKTHAEHEGAGINSPGPKYSWDSDLIHRREPAFSFGTSERDPKKKSPPRSSSVPPDLSRSQDSEDATSDAAAVRRNDSPAWSFGGLENPKANRFNGRALVQVVGVHSPGPRYNPDDSITRKEKPGFRFADADPLAAQMATRGSEKQYISAELSQHYLCGKASPGPAGYDTLHNTQIAAAPAFSMGRKEKILMKRVCPAPERARFISKELAKENMGAYSPGPKYKIPETLGIGGQYSLKFTMGASDRAFEELGAEVREKLGTVDKPYTAPSEARYISKELHKSSMMGKHSPGPKYNPKYQLIQKDSPAHSIQGKWLDKYVKPTKEEYEAEKEKTKISEQIKDPTVKKGPSYTIGTSKRGLLKEKGGEKASAVGRSAVGRDSPGPVYKPSFIAIDPKVKGGPSLGGLR